MEKKAKHPSNISIQEMLEFSFQLWEKHKNEWSPMEPQYGRNMLLWLISELGEVIDIIKKDGEEAIMKNKLVRQKTIEEITDCFMYLAETLNRYQISAKEFSQIYHQKMKYNLTREYKRRYIK